MFFFSGSRHTSDLKIGTPAAIPSGAWRYRVSSESDWPDARKFDLQLLSQRGSTWNCLSRSVSEIHQHVAGTLSSQPTTDKQTAAGSKMGRCRLKERSVNWFVKCKKWSCPTDENIAARTRWRHKWHDQTPWTCCQENNPWALQRIVEEWHSSCFMEKATIIPIHKKGKDKKDPNSYRPLSFLSCLGKLLERVINRRLIYFLEERKTLLPTQTGYRKPRRSAGPHCPRDRECLSRKEKGCLCFLWPNKSFWQSLAWRSPAEDTWERRFWKNVQMDPILSTRQLSQNKTGWPFEQRHENARSPTERSHLTDTLSPVHQQHHDCASPTCLQHPTCRWPCCVECIWIHYIFCLQNPGSCYQGRESSGRMSGVFRSVKWRFRPQFSPSPPPKKKSP